MYIHGSTSLNPAFQDFVERSVMETTSVGIRYPTLVAMLNRRSMMWRTTVIFHDVYVCTYLYVLCAY